MFVAQWLVRGFGWATKKCAEPSVGGLISPHLSACPSEVGAIGVAARRRVVELLVDLIVREVPGG